MTAALGVGSATPAAVACAFFATTSAAAGFPPLADAAFVAGAVFVGAVFAVVGFAAAVFAGAVFAGAAFPGAGFAVAVFVGAAFAGAGFAVAAFAGAAFACAGCAAAAFAGAAFAGAVFAAAILAGAALTGAVFAVAVFAVPAGRATALADLGVGGAALAAFAVDLPAPPAAAGLADEAFADAVLAGAVFAGATRADGLPVLAAATARAIFTTGLSDPGAAFADGFLALARALDPAAVDFLVLTLTLLEDRVEEWSPRPKKNRLEYHGL